MCLFHHCFFWKKTRYVDHLFVLLILSLLLIIYWAPKSATLIRKREQSQQNTVDQFFVSINSLNCSENFLDVLLYKEQFFSNSTTFSFHIPWPNFFTQCITKLSIISKADLYIYLWSSKLSKEQHCMHHASSFGCVGNWSINW